MEDCFLHLSAASAQLVWCSRYLGSSDGQFVCPEFSPVAPGVEGEGGPGGQHPFNVLGGLARSSPLAALPCTGALRSLVVHRSQDTSCKDLTALASTEELEKSSACVLAFKIHLLWLKKSFFTILLFLSLPAGVSLLLLSLRVIPYTLSLDSIFNFESMDITRL